MFFSCSENIHEQSPECHAAGQTAGASVPEAVFLLTTVYQHSRSDKPLIFPFHLHPLHHLVPGECAYLMCDDTRVTHRPQNTVRDIHMSTIPYAHTQIPHWEANMYFEDEFGMIITRAFDQIHREKHTSVGGNKCNRNTFSQKRAKLIKKTKWGSTRETLHYHTAERKRFKSMLCSGHLRFRAYRGF